MPTSYTPRDRLPKQFTGENTDIWGDILNAGLERIEEMKDGVLTLSVTGARTLNSANDNTDEAHYAIINVTGGNGGTITVPAVQKLYIVRVSSAVLGNIVMSAGGSTVTVIPGEMALVVFTGADAFKTSTMSAVTDPVNDQDVATKKYVDDASFDAAAGNLPGQTGNAGKFLSTDGSVAGWQAISYQNVQGLQGFVIACALTL